MDNICCASPRIRNWHISSVDVYRCAISDDDAIVATTPHVRKAVVRACQKCHSGETDRSPREAWRPRRSCGSVFQWFACCSPFRARTAVGEYPRLRPKRSASIVAFSRRLSMQRKQVRDGRRCVLTVVVIAGTAAATVDRINKRSLDVGGMARIFLRSGNSKNHAALCKSQLPSYRGSVNLAG